MTSRVTTPQHRARMKARFEKLRAAGLCTTCGKAPQRPKQNTCVSCIGQITANARATRQKRADAGLCMECGKNPHVPSKRLCGTCQVVANQRVAKCAAKRKAKAERESLCTACFKAPRPVGRKRCDECVLAHRLRTYKQFGLTREVFDSLGDCCRICSRRDELKIDHGHVSGKIRGLLCATCNVGLGMFRDDPALLAKAIEYVRATATAVGSTQIDQPTGDGRATEAQPRYLN